MQQFAPRTIRQTEDLVTREQGNPSSGKIFSSGMFNDTPVIPKDAIAYSLGYIPFDRELEPCGGCAVWATTTPPKTRTGLKFQQSGSRIGVITEDIPVGYVAEVFSPSEVGDFIVNDSGVPARIVGYIDANTIDVDTSTTTIEQSLVGWMFKQLNSVYYHKKSKKVIHHIGNDIYLSDINISSYTKCVLIGNRGLSNKPSTIEEQGDYAVVSCKEDALTGGIYRVDLTKNPPLYWKANCTNPATRITDGTETPKKTFKYKYTHTAAIIDGSSRLSAQIKHESGSCGFDSNLVDYGTHYSERPIGPESDDATYDQIVGGAVAATYQDPAFWAAVTNGQIKFTAQDETFNIAMNFTGVSSMAEVAKIIELAMLGCNPDVELTWDTDHFLLVNPELNGTLGYTAAGESGVNLLACMNLHAAGGAVKTSKYYYAPIEIPLLSVPLDPVTGKPERQYTHLPLYRSLDFGANGILKANNEEQFMLAADVPAASVFMGSVSAGVLTMTAGALVDGDVGSTLRFLDGTEVEITTVTGALSGTVAYAYDISSQPCAIGGDYSLSKAIRVIQFTRAAKVVTRTSGDTFTSADVGKVIFTPTERLHVTDYVDANTVWVAESGTDTAVVAGALDPQCRKWNDLITDDQMRGRVLDYSLWQRFHLPYPKCDEIRIGSGFAFAAEKESSNFYYQQILAEKEHLIGYYHPRQYLPLKDIVKRISTFPGKVVVYCGHSFYSIKTDAVTFDINAALQILLLYSIDWNEGIGVRSFSAVKTLPNGVDWLLTNEPAVRICDGENMSDNLAKDRCMKILKKLLPEVTIGYDQFNGVRIYGYEAELVKSVDGLGGGYGLVPYGTGAYKDALSIPADFPDQATRCVCHAIQPEQGIGFYEVPTDMPLPMANGSGAIEVFDANEQAHSIVFDHSTMKWWDISTRDGANGTDLTKVWTGKSGSNFTRSARFGEDKGTFEREFLRMLQAMAYFRPTKPENIGSSGYDSAGYPSGMAATMNLYIDGKLTPAATAATIPFDGVVKHDKKVDAHRIAMEISTNRGDHRIVGRQADYDNSKRAVEPDKRLSAELVLQKELAAFALYPDFIGGTLRNRYTGATIVSTGMTAVHGPEARKTCGIQFSTPITLGTLAMTSGSALFWLYGTAVLTVAGATGTVEEVGSTGSWHLKKVSGITGSGSVVFTPTGTARIAHARFYRISEISDSAAAYFLSDVVNNSGKIVLP